MNKAEMVVPSYAVSPNAMKRILNRHLGEYENFLDANETYEDAAYVLPLATETTWFWAGNIRVWFEYFGKRLCKKHVQDEHYRLALKMFEIITELFPMVKKAHPCKACRACKGVDE